MLRVAIDRRQVKNGELTYTGKIHSKKSGGFNIRGTLIPLLAPVEAEPIAAP